MNIPHRARAWARRLVCIGLFATAMVVQAAPQIPDFVYQGRLEQGGAPANGNFDLSFALFDAQTGGNAVGTAIQQPDFPVTDGLFSVSLAFPGAFTGTQLYLQVSVEGTPMLPRHAVATAPVSQFTLSGSISGPAGGDLVGTYPNPSIAAFAVTNGKIGSLAVSNSKIAADAITSSKIATGAVDAPALANGAVGTAAIASDSITRGKIAGGYSNGSIAVNVGANDCNTYTISVPGAEVNDMVFFNLQASATLPANMLIQPLKVTATDSVQIRACNIGATAASTGDIAIYVLTLR
ncbi:MAG: hypothetical protein J0L88_03545 [Xanthomonadales bacterium]|nr:hypothetical protein [Xanthomonadales bacterium]